LDWLLDTNRVDGAVAANSLESDDIPGLKILDRIIAALIGHSCSGGIVSQYSGAIIIRSNLDFASVGGYLHHLGSNFTGL
jgi:hypothetical protein